VGGGVRVFCVYACMCACVCVRVRWSGGECTCARARGCLSRNYSCVCVLV